MDGRYPAVCAVANRTNSTCAWLGVGAVPIYPIGSDELQGCPYVESACCCSGYELVGGTPEQFTVLVRRETAQWAEVVKRTGAKLD